MSNSASAPLNNTILVLGGDGYLGWPLSVKLALQNPTTRIVIADNGLRRRLVRGTGSDSLLPILPPDERVAAFRRIFGQDNLEYMELDVTSPQLTELIARERPHTIYHLAQQCSAPYSMSGVEEAVFTVNNNEGGNMRLLWAVRDHIPAAHLIKLGSFGEYQQCGLDICEGYYLPEYNGQKATVPAPFPRQSDDIYHVSKINDSNYISCACRKWGLRVTDIMQATVFGTWTPETAQHADLWTRMDYDEKFGTVLNRFLTQVLIGQPLTVYGTGKQRTGLMALSDSTQSLAELVRTIPERGEHRVINHVTEKSFCINEIADLVQAVARELSLGPVEVAHGVHDPRNERPSEKAKYDIETKYVSSHISKTPLQTVLRQTLQMISPYKDRIHRSVVLPRTKWEPQAQSANASASADNSLAVPKSFVPSHRRLGSVDVAMRIRDAVEKNNLVSDEGFWSNFREQYFPSRRINLNSGTLGTLSVPVRKASAAFYAEDLPAYPLGQYAKGRDTLSKIAKLANDIWPSATHEVTVNGSASQCTNLLALALARVAWKSARHVSRDPSNGSNACYLNVLTTEQEHSGGIGAFEKLPEFRVHYLSNEATENLAAFEQQLRAVRPDVCFFSHISCVTGSVFPVTQWAETVHRILPDAIVLVDVAQSLGVMSLPLHQDCDCVFGSVHKWLFGPRGAGLLWTTERFRKIVNCLNWSGEEIHPREAGHGFSIPGGQDFSVYAKLEAALRIYSMVGHEMIARRGAFLRKHFQERATAIFGKYAPVASFFAANPLSPCIATLVCNGYDPYDLYAFMNQHGVHVKCMKNKAVAGKRQHFLRFSFPYYETVERINEALNVLEKGFRSLAERGPLPVDGVTRRVDDDSNASEADQAKVLKNIVSPVEKGKNSSLNIMALM